jgi:hypothetical protein
MKIAPVSADLLIKLALAAAVLGGLYYVAKRVQGGLAGALDSVTGIPGRIVDSVKATAQTGGAAWQDGIAANPPTTPYTPTYKNPLVNDSGMDFGQISG